MTIQKIGIITSGGDCGGLNAVVKGAAMAANSLGIKAFIIPNGYAGLFNLADMDHLVELSPERVDVINPNLAGSEAGHSRVKIGKIDDSKKYERIKEGLNKFEINGLIISGGDDSGSVMVDLDKHGIKCIHAPKTMDLDLQTYSVGADSTINRISEFAQQLRTTAETHNRIMVVEVFGRYAGHTAFRGGIGADADAILLPEIPADFDVLYEDVKKRYMMRVRKSDVNAGMYLIVVAEGMKDAKGDSITDSSDGVDSFGHEKLAGAGKYVKQQLEKHFKKDNEIKEFMKEQGMFVNTQYETPEVRVVVPSHLVRCGNSSAFDVSFGMEAGAGAVHLLTQGISGATVVRVDGEEIKYLPTKEAIKQRNVDLNQVSLYEELGICFGRKPKKYNPKLKEGKERIERHL